MRTEGKGATHVRSLSSSRPGREHALQRFRASRGPEPTVPMTCSPVHTVLLVADDLEVAEELRHVIAGHGHGFAHARRDRKSTRLNSSHSQISYAVFCLKKKK